MGTPLNTKAAETNPMFMWIVSAQSSVDTFFFLSGFLFSMLTVKEMRNKNGKLNIAMGVVLRYVRLTPTLALGMLCYYLIWPWLADGPFSPDFQESIFRRCDISWWSELLYTMNFVPFNSDDVCM